MKNIFILETDKPSRLHHYDYETPLRLSKEPLNWRQARHIYITNDEEIKEGDWFIDDKYKQPMKYFGEGSLLKSSKKIILTTDSDLIADGVQPLEDSFLEQFVSNVVDYVEVEKELEWKSTVYDQPDVLVSFYSVSFPAEKSLDKQIRESAEALKDVYEGISQENKTEEKLYTKEDMMDFAIDVASYDNHSNPHKTVEEHFEDWFKYYKK